MSRKGVIAVAVIVAAVAIAAGVAARAGYAMPPSIPGNAGK